METYIFDEKDVLTGKTCKPIRYLVTEHGCWECVSHAKQTDGYCVIQRTHIKAGNLSLHRYSYMLYKGEIPDGLIVRHKCDNRICLNPDHLELGTKQDNSMDMVSRGRSKKCSNQGINHPRAKLTDEQVLFIYNDTTHKQCNLAKMFNISDATVSGIKRGRLWPHITQEGLFLGKPT